MGTSEIRELMIGNNRERWFVEHLQSHVEQSHNLCCKTCGKDIEQIADERLEKMLNDLKPLIDKLMK